MMKTSSFLSDSAAAQDPLEVLELLLEERRARVRAESTADELRDRLDRDSLTGALNDSAHHRELLNRLAGLVGSGNPFSAATLDLDGFKALQDRIGNHQAGDEALRYFRKCVEAQLSSADLFFRIHGDEHALILDVSCEDDLARLLQRLHGPFQTSWNGIPLTFTTSIGALVVRRPYPLQELLSELEELLYVAKSFGGVLVGPLPWTQPRLPLEFSS